MNAVEIEEAASELAAQPFDRAEFAYAFLKAFDNKETTIRKLRSGASNASDISEGVLQRSNIHIATCDEGNVNETLAALRQSPKTTTAKAKFILATDGVTLEAEDLISGEPLSTPFEKFADHFGFFLPLAGISTVKEIKNNPIDVKATGRLNKLYVELLKDNPDWATEDKRPALNHFMARLIFCFFSEDTGIFQDNIFTRTIETMSDGQSGNTHEVLMELFRAMDTPTRHNGAPDDRYRKAAGIKNWADKFPYVNGHLFSGSTDCPKFSRTARSYLLRAGELDWKQINPDIFGSMIQAIAEDEERGELGMHYTSVPNILKVLNPLFLHQLRAQLDSAGDNSRMLLNLRKRMSKIRVFDPACGSGNFLVIAYKEMRAIEAELNRRRDETELRSEIPLTNFRGIELRDFPAEVSRLALIIAEYQCDVLYRGQKEALAEFLPLNADNWITRGNALQLDWLSVCPPTGMGVKLTADDLFHSPLDQAQIDFENEGGETYICGNPPYKGTKNQSKDQKAELKTIFNRYTRSYGSLDYVSGWFLKASEYCKNTKGSYAFVSTNSICQGGQVPVLWPLILNMGYEISFCYPSFKWSNLASNKAGVTVSIIGVRQASKEKRHLFRVDESGETLVKEVDYINSYLIAANEVIVQKRGEPWPPLSYMSLGNAPYDGGNLILSADEVRGLRLAASQRKRFIRPLLGSAEIIDGVSRYCIWIEDEHLDEALTIEFFADRISSVREMRLASDDTGTQAMATRPHQFREMNFGKRSTIAVPLVSSESRDYLTPDLIGKPCSMTNKSYAIYDGELYCLSILSSLMHLVWISTVCGKLETRLSYSNKMGWNTFPIPKLTDQNKIDLTRCAENILLAREGHFPKTIADLYDPENMPDDLRRAHDENDEVLERIYIGRRFKNDTERLEKLFDLYTKMTAQQPQPTKKNGRKAA